MGRTDLRIKGNEFSSISKADSDEEIGEFWDTHDFTKFDTDAPDAEFEELAQGALSSNCWRYIGELRT